MNQRVKGAQKCTVRFERGYQGLDSAIMKFEVEKAPYYFMVPFFGYYEHPNELFCSFIFKNYFAKSSLFKPFQQTEFGYKYRYDKS